MQTGAFLLLFVQNNIVDQPHVAETNGDGDERLAVVDFLERRPRFAGN
jgi:hypothetical protein